MRPGAKGGNKLAIANAPYRYDSRSGRRKKPFYLRWWFYAPIFLFFLGIFSAWVGWHVVRHMYSDRVKSYDLGMVEKMEAASVIYDVEGYEIAKFFIQNRNPVPYSEISPFLVKAVIAAEDNRFYDHDGVDYLGIIRAALANYRAGRIRQGASTVTQQLARNSFDLKERTYERKLVEMFLSNRIEENYSKDKIMELYLNRVYFGSGFYGAESAARGYFGKSAKDLNPGESAMLAGLLKSPQALSPWNNLEAATKARDFVLKRMRELGFLTRQQYQDAESLRLVVRRRTNPHKVSYAVDYIRQQVIDALGFDQAMNGGLKIYSTIDSRLQRTAEISMRKKLDEVEARPDYKNETFGEYRQRVAPIEEALNKGHSNVKMPSPKYLQGAILALDNQTGAVRVMVGGRDFRHSEYNRALQARRPAGTIFTPFVFAAAFDKGIFPGEVVQDACIDNRFVMIGGTTGILGEWGVEKVENEYEGPIPARDALAKGKNAATIRLGFRTGLEAVKNLAQKAGIRSPLREYSNAFLGSSELTLEELTLGYTIFPGLGQRPKETYIIEKIANANGDLIFEKKPTRVEALKETAAFQTHTALVDALRLGTGAKAYSEYNLAADVSLAGKTGTAYRFTDTYFIGYSSSLTCGVWIGYDLPKQIYRGAFGNDLALPVWTDIMNASLEKYPARPWLAPQGLEAVQICKATGLLATPKCPGRQMEFIASNPLRAENVYTEYGTKEQIPVDRCDLHGGGVRSFVKHVDEAEWPRAAAAVDLAMIRPIAVASPALLGLNDVYNSIQPNSRRLDDDDVPVAKAIPVEAAETPSPDPQDLENSPEVRVAEAAQAVPVATPDEPEVRRAEAVRPAEAPFDRPIITMPPPPPINF